MLSLGWPKNIKKIWIEWHNRENEEYIKKSEDLKLRIEEKGTEVINWH
jgi:hypothetical protein